MRINCPSCGERTADEFLSFGSADVRRPEGSEKPEDWVNYVYLRDNPAGRHREWFFHATGCRAWLQVTRDTRTHEIASVVEAASVKPDVAA